MASLAVLRKQAKEAGVPKGAILGASTAAELQSVIADHEAHESGNSKARKKSAVKKSSVAKKSSGRKSVPAKSSKTGAKKAKRQTTATRKQNRKSTATKSNGYVPKGGRNVLDSIDFGDSDGWNPRDGSAPDRIIKAVKKARGNRAKAFEALKGEIRDFVNPKKRDGTKRDKSEMTAMLKYRISRTMFDFAVATGQHEPATNRVKYGTGGTGQGVWKPAKARGGKKTASTGRKAQKAAQSRTGGRKKTATKAKGRKKTAKR